MKTQKNSMVAASLLGMALSVSFVSFDAHASDAQLDKAIADGQNSFAHSTFNGNGKVCESCHVGGGKEAGKLPNGKAIPSLANAAAIFPRINQKSGKLVTLSDQVRNCSAMALQGTPPEYGSAELNSLVSYITSLAQGKAIDMGGMPK